MRSKIRKITQIGTKQQKNHAISYILTEKHHLTSIQVKRKEKNSKIILRSRIYHFTDFYHIFGWIFIGVFCSSKAGQTTIIK